MNPFIIAPGSFHWTDVTAPAGMRFSPLPIVIRPKKPLRVICLEQEAGIKDGDSPVLPDEPGMVFVELALPFGNGAAHAVVWGNSSDVADLSRDC